MGVLLGENVASGAIEMVGMKVGKGVVAGELVVGDGLGTLDGFLVGRLVGGGIY